MAFKGVSTFAAMNKRFPIDRVLRVYPKDIKKPGCAILYEYFGKNWTFPAEFCDKFQDRRHLIEFHLCFRNPAKNLAKRAERITEKMEKLGNDKTKIVICPVLEDVLTDKDYRRIAKSVRSATPYKLVRCSLHHCPGGGFYEESHGATPYFCRTRDQRIYNPDGTSVDFNDGDRYFNKMSIEQFKTQAKKLYFAWFIWYAPLQGLGNARSWTDVKPVKDREFILTPRAFKGMKRLLKTLA